MPSLKDLRLRIRSVKSTQKITAAMKMVAAAKLRRAQEQAEEARPYAERMERMIASLAANMGPGSGGPPLLAGTGSDKVHLVVVATADRGLCGGFNSSIVRAARAEVYRLQGEGKTVKILCVGRKGRDQLRRLMGELIVDTIEHVARPRLTYDTAAAIAERIAQMYAAGEFDVCSIFYNRFKSAMTQIVTRRQLIPVALPEVPEEKSEGLKPLYEFEPSEEQILAEVLPRNLAVQVYAALLENQASEHGARMTAMDSATRNAGDMIDRLTLNYNRTRQAQITKELIEIISGAEAL